DRPACVAEATSAFAARQSARYGATAAARRRPGPQQCSWRNVSGMLQTTSTERRAAGGDRPRSGGCARMPSVDGRKPIRDGHPVLIGYIPYQIMNSNNSYLQKEVVALGLERYRRHIFLCADQNKSKCASRETGLEAWSYLKKRLKELGLAGPDPLVYRTKA